MQDIVDRHGRYTDKELVEILIREDTLWNRAKTTSGTLIDFTQLLYTDYKKAVFEMAYEFQVSHGEEQLPISKGANGSLM